MSRPLLNLFKGSFLLGCLLIISAELRAQGCCPEPGQCNPCNGGISTLTLRYHGVITTLVTINDNSVTPVFNGVVSPGSTFTVTGKSNGSFVGDFIHITLAGLFHNATIRVTCGLEFDPSTYFGLFTIVSAHSKNGGVMCCTSNNGAVDPPQIFGCPGNVSASTSSGCNAVATWTAPAAPDCDVISFTTSHAPGSVFPVGATTVTYTATNINGLSATCSFTVTVTDTTAPTVSAPTPGVVVNTGSDCKATATWTPPQFADNCSVSFVTSTHAPGTVFSLGTHTVTYTATDGAGNTGTSSFTVTVKDATAPAVANCPSDITIQAANGCSATASWTPPVFTDYCSAVTVTGSHTPGATFTTGSTTVTYSGKDAAGNTTVCSFKVVVKDGNAPQFTSCPPDTTLFTTAVGGRTYSWAPPIAGDDCSTPELTASHQPGDVFPIGATTVVYTATDVSGNSSTCSFVVSVKSEQTLLDVAQLVTPDGNSENDTWIIGNIELYKENKVTIVDRWGSVIYSESGYDNEQRAWRGRNQQGTIVPSGTYFYSISVRSGTKTNETRGFIEVVR